MLSPVLETFITQMPKVELHLHLEGTITPRTLLVLAERNGVTLPANDEEGVAALFRYRDFGDFLNVFMAMTRAIVSGEDFEQLAYELGHDLAQQNVRYAEVMISPMQYLLRGLDLYEVIEGTMAGFAQVEREADIVLRLALDYGRQYGPERAWESLEVACALMHRGVVGWSIGGNEIGHPPEPFAPVFAAARAAGLGVMAHAGEVVGPVSVWGAIEFLEAQRVGHGVRSVDDPLLVQTLAERGIVLDICPSSNLLTGAIKTWASHPLPSLLAAGVQVTINSDDPTFFATTLTEEYRRSLTHLGLTLDQLCGTVSTAARATFLPASDQEALTMRVEQEITLLRQRLGV
ncbi:adenosine deaminase [Candidatus Chloroploca asiatica]|uniref:Adenosine deaminase n=1 Tax=Candidatus Chloroploca asiatica TaxID=1506545 RepID=A0A2H3L5I6_9CHLR|nr:adenosine deaminase [Candidatus Chloroploca asiatica]PDV97495.1 adenosine deaminase [Candidatus Chloroploca asiatica]